MIDPFIPLLDACEALSEQAEIARNQAVYVREYSRTLHERSAWLRARRDTAFHRAADLLEQRRVREERLAQLLVER